MKKTILCLSGHDPTGGAGVHADIEACAAQGAHALSIITALTVQDTQNVARVHPVAPMLLAQQLEALLGDCTVHAVKIGLLGDAQQLPYLVPVLKSLGVPVVLDPILRAGGGASLVSAQLQVAMEEQLFPLVTVLTPNAAEARRLAPRATSLDEAAQVLLARGCANLLITGGDEPTTDVRNAWYRTEAPPQRFSHTRHPARFHGAGCTLAATLAARLALGAPLERAIAEALEATHAALGRAYAVGQGRLIPGRLP